MNRTLLILTVAAMLLTMTACGQAAPADATVPQTAAPTVAPTEPAKPLDIPALYEEMAKLMPQMIMMDETMLMNFCGIDAADCVSYAAAISYDGLRTDEVWLVEAVSEEAMDRIEQLAQTRLKMKGEETISYAPEQYKVVEQARLIREGQYLALIVSPDVEALAELFYEALGK